MTLTYNNVFAQSFKILTLFGQGSIESLHRKSPDNASDQYEFVGSYWKTRNSGGELHFIIPGRLFSLGLGYSSSTVDADYESSTRYYYWYGGIYKLSDKSKFQIQSNSLDFSLVFTDFPDEIVTLQLGVGIDGKSTVSRLELSNIDLNYLFDYKSVKTSTSFINIGRRLNNHPNPNMRDWYIVIGVRTWEVIIDQYYNGTKSNTYSSNYSLGNIGIGLRFK